MTLLRRFSISQRLWAIVLLVVLVVGGLVLEFASRYHQSLLDAREIKTRHIVEAGLGVMAHFHRREQSGSLSREDAQAAAQAALGGMRYGNDDYFWIHNRNIVMVHHPFSPHLDGTDISQVADPTGKRLFYEMEQVVAREGSGMVNYLWPKPGFDQPVPKLSYVAEFEPWGWVLGSGIYLDDVRRDFWQTLSLPLAIAVLGLLLLVGMTLLIASSIVRPLRQSVRAMNDIASGEGDLTRRLDTRGSDELASLARGFNRFCDKLVAVVTELRQLAEHNRAIAREVNQAMGDARNSYDRQKREMDTVATAVEQMSVTAQDMTQRVTESAGAAQDASDHARSGEQKALDTRDAMERLAEDIANTSQAMTALDQQSQTISGVLDVIHSVAEQTNLLALNAAIEAARAGEQGRGFAVVADEVRTLASRTQASTDEIREMINALLTGTANAVAAMETSHGQSEAMRGQVSEVKRVLATIKGAVNTITDMTHHIASAAEQQSQTANTIAASLNQLSGLSEEVLVELKETAGNTEQMNEASEKLEQLIEQFKI